MSSTQASRPALAGPESRSEPEEAGCPVGMWVASMDGLAVFKYTFLSAPGSSKRYTCLPTNTSDIGILSVTSGSLLRSISGFKVYSGETRMKYSWREKHLYFGWRRATLVSNQRKVYTLLTADLRTKP